MCVIAIKPIGHRLPSAKEWRKAMQHNSDGAGFMFNLPNDAGVFIRKGFSTQKQLYRELRQVLDKLGIEETEVTVVLHARIGTSGGNVPQNCHPFPNSAVVADLKATTIIAPIGVAHNGILFMGNNTMSDTQMFIRDCLSRYTWADLSSDSVKATLGRLTEGNKFVFLSATGEFVTLGTWTEDAAGLLWSNRFHMAFSWPETRNNFRTYAQDDHYMDWPSDERAELEIDDHYIEDGDSTHLTECSDCEYDYEPSPDAPHTYYGDCTTCQWEYTRRTLGR